MEIILVISGIVFIISITGLYMYLVSTDKIKPFMLDYTSRHLSSPTKKTHREYFWDHETNRGNFWDHETKKYYKWDELMKLYKERESKHD